MTLTLFLFSYARAVEIDFYKNKNGKGRKHMKNDFLLSIFVFLSMKRSKNKWKSERMSIWFRWVKLSSSLCPATCQHFSDRSSPSTVGCPKNFLLFRRFDLESLRLTRRKLSQYWCWLWLMFPWNGFRIRERSRRGKKIRWRGNLGRRILRLRLAPYWQLFCQSYHICFQESFAQRLRGNFD